MKTAFTFTLDLNEMDLLREMFDTIINGSSTGPKARNDYVLLYSRIKEQIQKTNKTLIINEIDEKILKGLLSEKIKMMHSLIQDNQVVTEYSKKVYQESSCNMSNLLNQICHE